MKKRRPRKPRAKRTSEPGHVKDQVALAFHLGVERKTIQRWRKIQGNPGAKPNGTYDLQAWREWVKEHGLKQEESLTQTDLKARQIALQNEKLAFQVAVMKGKYVLVSKVAEDVGTMIGEAKKVLLSGPQTLAPQVVGETVISAEQILREWLQGALNKLHQDPLGKGT